MPALAPPLARSQLPWHIPTHQPLPNYYDEWIGHWTSGEDVTQLYGRPPMGVDTVVGDAQRVTTRRTEEWHFSAGEVLKLPVVCIHEIEGGKIKRWHEFWNMPAFMAQLPQSWLEARAQEAS